MIVDNVSKTLAVIVNGTTVSTGARNLAELVARTDRDGARVATALNGTFVARAARVSAVLSPGDVIEILSARQGG